MDYIKTESVKTRQSQVLACLLVSIVDQIIFYSVCLLIHLCSVTMRCLPIIALSVLLLLSTVSTNAKPAVNNQVSPWCKACVRHYCPAFCIPPCDHNSRNACLFCVRYNCERQCWVTCTRVSAGPSNYEGEHLYMNTDILRMWNFIRQ